MRANSPVIETRDQFQAMFEVTYKFNAPNPFVIRCTAGLEFD